MIHRARLVALAATLVAAALPLAAGAPTTEGALQRRPDAVVDLGSREGLGVVQGAWRFREASIVEVEHRQAGPDLKASGAPNRTHDVAPRAARIFMDDDGWTAIDPTTLAARRGSGRLSFNWYRLNVTLPERVARFDTTGSTVVFEIVVDDYAEVWVDGRLPLVLGQGGGPLVAGYNAPNRVVLTRDARPGQQFQLAVFAANGPLSDPPGNFIWLRGATLDFFSAERSGPGIEVALEIDRRDPALDRIVPPAVRLDRLASGFSFAEGPVWHPDGYLLFSDPNDNRIYRYSPADAELSVYRTKSGYSGLDIGEYGQPGSNGLGLDPQGRLTIAEHGNRRVTRLEPNGVLTVMADNFEGRRLNSPNDLAYRSDGSLYFTDPPFGLPRFHDDPRRELDFTGVYRWAEGSLQLVARDLTGPNGIDFSPDERYLYVANWDTARKVVMRYAVLPDGTLAEGEVFFDMGGAPGDEALDGLEVDAAGNLYVSGPGGLWILSPAGRHLGTLRLPELAANFAWGDADRRTLYLTARTSLYRLRLSIPEAGAGRSTP